MSKALKYLTQARPEAMASYFDFLRANGQRLDPKTRDLISIITKVANQTETGLRQYARRAIKDGASSDEILDALLMAFSALGLTKILWAIDILLDMGILNEPVDEESIKPREEQEVGAQVEPSIAWYLVGAVNQFEDREVSWLEVEDKPLYVVKEISGYRTFEAQCPHKGTVLDGSHLFRSVATCPWHGWQFDVRTGVCIKMGHKGLQEFENKVEDDYLYVSW